MEGFNLYLQLLICGRDYLELKEYGQMMFCSFYE